MLNAVEQHHETFLIRRGTKVVARMGPATQSNGKSLKVLLKSHPPDKSWAKELAELREVLVAEEQPWID